MKIIELKNKVKIVFEYSKKLMNYGIITNEDLLKLNFRVFLKDGSDFLVKDIKNITFNIKDKTELKEAKDKNGKRKNTK